MSCDEVENRDWWAYICINLASHGPLWTVPVFDDVRDEVRHLGNMSPIESVLLAFLLQSEWRRDVALNNFLAQAIALHSLVVPLDIVMTHRPTAAPIARQFELKLRTPKRLPPAWRDISFDADSELSDAVGWTLLRKPYVEHYSRVALSLDSARELSNYCFDCVMFNYLPQDIGTSEILTNPECWAAVVSSAAISQHKDIFEFFLTKLRNDHRVISNVTNWPPQSSCAKPPTDYYIRRLHSVFPGILAVRSARRGQPPLASLVSSHTPSVDTLYFLKSLGNSPLDDPHLLETPLLLAADHPNGVPVMQFFIEECGVQLTTKVTLLDSLLQRMALRGNVEGFELCLSHVGAAAIFLPHRQSLIFVAAVQGRHLRMLKWLHATYRNSLLWQHCQSSSHLVDVLQRVPGLDNPNATVEARDLRWIPIKVLKDAADVPHYVQVMIKELLTDLMKHADGFTSLS